MSVDRFAVLSQKVRAEYPRFNVKERDKSWLRVIFWVLQKITRESYSSFATTIFSTLYVGPGWFADSNDGHYKLLRHEMVHIRQFHCFPLGRWAWPLNHIITAFCYLFILPVLWTFRAKFEREGYVQTMLVDYELRGQIPDHEMKLNAAWFSEIFGGSSYFYMWRRKAAFNWAMETQRKINAGEIQNPKYRVDDLHVA